jgi:hypothetical protein
MSVISEITNNYSAISSYYKDLATSIASGSDAPNITTLMSVLDNAELITFCNNLAEGSPGFQVGAAQDAALEVYGLQRETQLVIQTKTQILGNCESYNTDQAQFYDEQGAFYLGILKGAPTSGAKS